MSATGYEDWLCKDCGRKNDGYTIVCAQCGKDRE